MMHTCSAHQTTGERQPVDVLEQLLQERLAVKLVQIYQAYGAPEVTAMCHINATAMQCKQ